MRSGKLKTITVYLILSVLFGLAALAGSTTTICHFTHSTTYINTNSEQILLSVFAIFNLAVVLVELFKSLPPIQRKFQEGDILVDNHQFELDSSVS
jgi:high-affinity nickel permease